MTPNLNKLTANRRYYADDGSEITAEVLFLMSRYNMPVEGIPSDPPVGKKKITNIYWDPDTEEFVFDKEE